MAKSLSMKNINRGLTQVGKKSIPIIEKGVSMVYNTMASGVDMGRKTMRSRHIAGGSRRRHRRRSHRRRHRRH